MKVSDLIFDSVQLLYYRCRKSGGSDIVLLTG